MDIKIKLRFIKSVYLIGFLLDGLTGIDMILSTFMPSAVAIPYTSTASSFRFAMGWGAALMLGWTLILLWGALKPIERRSVLLFTIIPVVLGLVITEILVDPVFMTNLLIFQFCVIIPLFVAAYIISLLAYRQSENLEK
ncbi:MAG: hypothetical protein MUP85_03445 [Candidatus Lokiarchaeota archaeon]|nr:hypothetical protein [Candidatus Lokiarchaeota archaeon]